MKLKLFVCFERYVIDGKHKWNIRLRTRYIEHSSCFS